VFEDGSDVLNVQLPILIDVRNEDTRGTTPQIIELPAYFGAND
jgi:hypothetical protein